MLISVVVAKLDHFVHQKLLDDCLIKNTDDTNFEGLVFYHKMKADYHRYLAEVSTDDDRKGILQ